MRDKPVLTQGKETIEANVVRLQSKANSEFGVWRQVGKRLLQKAACVNTFVLSKFGYYNRILPLSKEVADAIGPEEVQQLHLDRKARKIVDGSDLPSSDGRRPGR